VSLSGHQERLRFRLMMVHGIWQRKSHVKNLNAGKLEDLTLMLGGRPTASRDFNDWLAGERVIG
jgi:hypothetical protein